MTDFFRLFTESDKPNRLLTACKRIREGKIDESYADLPPSAFDPIPGKPFAYWVSDAIRQSFASYETFENGERTVRAGLQTGDDYRFVRCWWEIDENTEKWRTFAKGGAFSQFYFDIPLVLNWQNDGKELTSFSGSVIRNPSYYKHEGLTWPLRASRFCPQALPKGSIISVRGSGVYSNDPLLFMALFSSSAVDLMMRMLSGREGHPQYDIGDVSLIPVPECSASMSNNLKSLAFRGWHLKRMLDSVNENSHAFLLPVILRERLGKFDIEGIRNELARVAAEIDKLVLDLYEFSVEDRKIAQRKLVPDAKDIETTDENYEGGTDDVSAELSDDLMSWAVGVAFSRFDWRLATGERGAPPEPGPFDPLPAKSPGMLPYGAEPFHRCAGILVDDSDHQHDLPRLIEQVVETVDAQISQDIRRWLQKAFFPLHLQCYSQSRRKSPIYWPLSTVSGSYTLWLYCPELTSQTLFTAVNDFVEPKLNSVSDDLSSLHRKGGARSKIEEKELERLEDLQQELADLRDTLLSIAPSYRPDKDDGVQITASPLWSMFQHKPWQKVLKDTWKQLEKGDLDWAHLALNYWPDRVLRKCREDRSLAIAHDVEELFWEEVEVPVIRRGKDTGDTKLEWQPMDLSESEIDVLIKRIIEERGL